MSEESTLSRSRFRAAASRLDRLNHAPVGAAEAALLSCCGSRRWARLIAAHRPYPDLEALLAAGDEASYDLTPADLDEALADESVVGHELPPADSLGALAAHTALQAAHDAYEHRFGHVFVICLDDLRPEERLDRLLSGIRDRLGNEREEERDNAAEELRRIARGRLARLASSQPCLPRMPGFRIA
ncbi:2-oxo-4-hydroxy-4-carboxy-5-ureidoimidazoline decarboxylase [Streptomyces hygroscopicus]|uniref:2-oxo-4-hydroxy-4-carboxy-5-ureidoimidazoline decarboxylase n=1 Tax=Streptomyces hygroscopicus TaxID=1912 RepID=UPI00076787E0|nr:2-oxo-4-hydroxy-4-carboxy-5-ureidoimidazoline decarboxylase [Streptomyces hygroscopicus]